MTLNSAMMIVMNVNMMNVNIDEETHMLRIEEESPHLRDKREREYECDKRER